MNLSIEDEIDRCDREIAAIDAALRSGHPDVAGLCLALSDWSVELRILKVELARHNLAVPDKKSHRRGGRWLGADRRELLSDSVNPVARLRLGALDTQSHLLPERAAQESADTMRLPAGGLHHLGERRAFLPTQQAQNLGFLRAIARGSCCLPHLGGLGALGRLCALGRALSAVEPFLRHGKLRRALCAPFRTTGGCVRCFVRHRVVDVLSALRLRITIHHSVRKGKQVEAASSDVPSKRCTQRVTESSRKGERRIETLEARVRNLASANDSWPRNWNRGWSG